MDWQPIETAPKDGRPILAASTNHDACEVVCWQDGEDSELREGYLTSYDRVATSSYRPGSRPASPALALCIALLRTLRTQDQGDSL